MYLIYTALTLLLLCLIIFFEKWKRLLLHYYYGRNFVGPKTLPLLGNAHMFFGIRSEDAQPILADIFSSCGKTVKIWLGFSLYIFMQDPNDLECILTNKKILEKSPEYNFIGKWLCEGLITSKPGKWSKRRKIITPAFHFNILEEFVESFERNSRVFVKMLRDKAKKKGGPIQIDHLVHLLTLDVICETAMGISLNAQVNAATEFTEAIKTIATILHHRMINPLYRFNIIYQFSKLARQEKKALAVLHGYSEKVIIERREELLKAKENAEQQQTTEVAVKPKMAFLDILLKSKIDGKPLSNLDIREEVDTFMFAGHDTTSSAIHFCLYNLATHPECQEKCFKEILQVFGNDKSKPVNYKDLHNLHYMELCIKETLRLYPTVPVIGRTVTEDCDINGKFVPAGAHIIISVFHLGRQADLFPEPLNFKPERFEINCNTNKINPYAYIPFSAGPRNCVGQKFAMLELKTVLTNVLRHYELEYAGNKDEQLVLLGELTISAKDPLLFRIKPRVY